jgi:hypothetical protein
LAERIPASREVAGSNAAYTLDEIAPEDLRWFMRRLDPLGFRVIGLRPENSDIVARAWD